MKGHLFIAPGDVTQLSAHAIAYSTNNALSRAGNLISSFEANVPGFADWFASLRRPRTDLCQVGDTFWLTLSRERKPHGVVVVVSTGLTTATDDKAALAVRAALTTAVGRLRGEVGLTGRLLIALPTFRVGMGGDRTQRLRSARVQVTTALETLADLPDVDAAFVPYTPTLHQIFLEARRQVLGDPAVEPERYPGLEDALLHRECVLFVGAGLSRGTGLPDWSELISRLSADLQIDRDGRHDYLDLAQWHRERFGAEALAAVIRSTFGSPAQPALPTLAHYLLLTLPIRHAITTNYDDLLERTLTALKRYPVKITRQQDVARTGQGQGVYVVKLHGDAAEPDEVVLTRDDYDDFFQRRPAMALLLEGLLLNQTFFFVGYSLRDPNFRQVYSRIARMLREARRPAYATAFETAGPSGPYLTQQWRHKQLQLINIPGASVEEQEQQFVRFLDRLAERVTLRTPRLLLTPDVEASPQMQPLRTLLITEVGRMVDNLVLGSQPGHGGDLRHLASVLTFLTEHGWRPDSTNRSDLCGLWEHLATQTPDRGERRQWLILALTTTEAFADVQRIRQKLADLESS